MSTTTRDARALTAVVTRTVEEEGADRVGVCTVEPFDDVRRAMEERVESGFSAGLRFTYGNPERATNVRLTFPWAERLVVAALAYLPEAGSPGPKGPGSARVARFAVDDRYRPIEQALGAGMRVLRDRGYRAELLMDDNRLSDRAAAVRAGIAWWGKNTLALAPGVGPWFLLGSIVTDAELDIDTPMVRGCGTCSACLPACPTGALVAPGVLDARRCLSALAQLPGSFPLEYREAMGDRLYGCDDCLEACPPGARLLRSARDRRGRVDLVELLALSDEEILSRFGHFYVPRRQARYLRRNALVALGNAGDRSHLKVLGAYLHHDDALLRGHAAWALGRIGGPESTAALRAALEVEGDPEAREEIVGALARAAA